MLPNDRRSRLSVTGSAGRHGSLRALRGRLLDPNSGSGPGAFQLHHETGQIYHRATDLIRPDARVPRRFVSSLPILCLLGSASYSKSDAPAAESRLPAPLARREVT